MNDIRKLLESGLAAAGTGDLMYSRSRSLQIKAFRGEIASFTESANTWVAARVFSNGRLGTAFSEKVDGDSIREAVARAGENATFADEDPGNRLFERAETGDHDGRRGSLETRSTDEKKAMTLAAETAARGTDSRIVNVPYCYYYESDGEQAIANTAGLAKSGLAGSCGCFISVMAREGEETQTGSEFAVAATPDELDMEAAARIAATRALAKLGAREIDSGSYRVVFENISASELLGAFVASPVSPFYGENIQKGRSMLAGMLGERIGSELFTIADDPLRGLNPVFFDGDGVDATPLTLVNEGTFDSVVHTVYSAAREEGAATTGHASRSEGGVSTGLHHPYLENGSGSLDTLLETMGTGLLVTEMAGLHAGLNPVTGDFSLSAKGFLVESGKRSYPVTNIVVAGNFFELATGLTAKAGDIRVDTRGGFDAPSILIEKLSVSGR